MDNAFNIDIDYFSPEFVPAFYRSLYPDLKGFSDDALKKHYDEYGFYAGRQTSPHQMRETLHSALNQLSGTFLEIGPLSNPFLTGENVFYFDVLDAARLCEKARSHGYSLETMPKTIHYWHEHGDMSGIDRKFDIVFSSHNIEHQHDLVAHLKQVENVLKSDGMYVMLIPDKRFCFDHFLPSSTLDDIIDVHLNKKDRSLLKYLDHNLFIAHNNPVKHWEGDHEVYRVNQLDPTTARDIVSSAYESYARGEYLDSHHWHFWPDQFRYLMTQLNGMGLIQLRPHRVYQTPYHRFEFVAILSKQETELPPLQMPDEAEIWRKMMQQADQRRAQAKLQRKLHRRILRKVRRLLMA